MRKTGHRHTMPHNRKVGAEDEEARTHATEANTQDRWQLSGVKQHRRDRAGKEPSRTTESLSPRTKATQGGDRPTHWYSMSLNPQGTSAGWGGQATCNYGSRPGEMLTVRCLRQRRDSAGTDLSQPVPSRRLRIKPT